MFSPEPELNLSKREITAVLKDAVKGAESVNLVYIDCTKAGYTRKRKGKTFLYYDGEKKVTDPESLSRIKKLVIPPAWESVWICKNPNGHLQVTGFDALKRKQYRYHELWSKLRNYTKFYRMLEFGKTLPDIRKQIHKHLNLPGYPREKVLALVVSLLERTTIRIGNASYEKLYGSFGLTTLKDKHVNIKADNIQFTFTGKKGVKHNIGLKSRRLAKMIQACKDLPGKELFQYVDENGTVKDVDSGMVNEYIHSISNGDFTAKDFRTWVGSVQALIGFKQIGLFEKQSELKRNINAMFSHVAGLLGNTVAVCKKYYVHPVVVKLYEEGKLEKYIKALDVNEYSTSNTELTKEEETLMKILRNQ